MPTDTVAELERLAVAVANSPLCPLKVKAVFCAESRLHGEAEAIASVVQKIAAAQESVAMSAPITGDSP
jgi:hypothetical protein